MKKNREALCWFAGGIILFNSTFFIYASQSPTLLGPLSRVNKTATAMLDTFSTTSNQAVQKMIEKYAVYGGAAHSKNAYATYKKDLASGAFDSIVQECAILNEAFFAHLGLLMDSSIAAGIDNSKTETIDSAIALQSGLDRKSQVAIPHTNVTIPEQCGTMFNTSRYIRGFGNSLGDGIKATPTNPLDSFYGVLLINIAWQGSEKPTFKKNGKVLGHFNASEGDKHQDNVYWISCGVNVSSFQEEVTFVPTRTVGVSRVEGGIDSWQESGSSRVLSFVITDRDGSAAFSSPIKIAVSGGDTIKIVQYPADGGSKTVSVNAEAQKFLQRSSALPWAIVVVATNEPEGKAIAHNPTLQVAGLIRLNPMDFPLKYQASGAPFIKQPFTAALLSEGASLFSQQIIGSAGFSGSSVTQHLQFGDCKDMSFDLTLSTTDEYGMYIQPVNMALAKLRGALDYNWGTKYSMQQALAGGQRLLNGLFAQKEKISGASILKQMEGNEPLSDDIFLLQKVTL